MCESAATEDKSAKLLKVGLWVQISQLTAALKVFDICHLYVCPEKIYSPWLVGQ